MNSSFLAGKKSTVTPKYLNSDPSNFDWENTTPLLMGTPMKMEGPDTKTKKIQISGFPVINKY